MFAGFVFATSNDLIGLVQSAAIDTTTTDFVTNEAATTSLLDLLGGTIFGTGGSSTTGLFNDIVQLLTNACPFELDSTIGAGQRDPNFAALRYYSTAQIILDDGGVSATGLYLFRQVPEPPTNLVFAVGRLIFGKRRPWNDSLGKLIADRVLLTSVQLMLACHSLERGIVVMPSVRSTWRYPDPAEATSAICPPEIGSSYRSPQTPGRTHRRPHPA